MHSITRTLRCLIAPLLLPAAILAGTIDGTVRGPDSTSAGIPNAKVLLTRSPGGGGSRVTLDSTVTNGQGGYSFTNLPTVAAPASYRVTASAAGFQNANSAGSALDTAATITLNIILPLPPAPGKIMGTVHAVDSTGAGVAGAKVVLNRSSGGGARTPVDSTITDAQGLFSFATVTPGSYGIAVTDTGYQTYTRNTLTLAAGATDSLLIILILPFSPASILGTVRGPDSTGPLLPDAMVVLSKPGTAGGVRVKVDSIKTDAQGKFAFANLPAAENYGIDIAPPNGTVRAYSDHNIDLRGVNDTETVVMAASPGPGTIKGRVTGPDTTKPLVGQMVVLTRSVSATDSTRIHADSMVTDALGMYAFVNIAAYNDYGILVASADTSLRVSNRTGIAVDRDTVIRNVTLRAVVGILSRALSAQGIRVQWHGEELSLGFAPAGRDRTLTVFGISGAIRFHLAIPSGAVQALVPGRILRERGLLLTLTGSNGLAVPLP